MGHNHYSHKNLKYVFVFNLLKHFLNIRPVAHKGKKILSAGNILFSGLSMILLVFFILTALADILNGLPVSRWLVKGWNYIAGLPISDIATESEKLITEAAKKTTPQDIISYGQLTLSSIGLLLFALLDEILGIGLLTVAIISRLLNQFTGRPIALLSWILLFSSLVPSAVKHL